MIISTDLCDKNGKQVKVGDAIIFSTEPDMLYPEEAIRLEGEVVFCCSAFGIGSKDYIPSELKMCGNDNFVSFWELYNRLDLAQFDDLEYYLEIV